ncbi:CDP-alcohol phosphatidyltransferase family protein [Synechococcales cyanobacterium C]|uniref:CDP-alcohol phosphatidyltransferase family protein n=1 Tax=Petrachloros mirabilis ULC683 TaxID=2781853 RepID=A0A8K2AN85_9CYAN|nr:CDP-alcohol phosphatidyltransferase family protein [Petrachloros mirabilis]NCJ04941.1 CDP-alcohol phosphatidyltransferase family protein [Petrachloros mirabilis ULC683]
MPSVYQLKPAFQNLLRPLVNRLASRGVSANQVTVLAALLSMGAGGTVALWHPLRWPLLLIPVALFIRMALNAIDGMLAREHSMKTTLGEILNELGDVISDAALYLPFGLIPGIHGYLVVPVVILAIISELAGVLGATTGQRRYEGPMGKSDRAVVFATLALILTFRSIPSLWLDGVWISLLGLLVVTIMNRIRQTLLEQKSHDLDAASS